MADLNVIEVFDYVKIAVFQLYWETKKAASVQWLWNAPFISFFKKMQNWSKLMCMCVPVCALFTMREKTQTGPI